MNGRNMAETLLHLLHESSPDAGRIFLQTVEGTQYTYAQFMALSARQAHALRSLGVRPGDRVAVQVDKSPEALALYLACMRAGAVYLPLNTAYTLSELTYFIEDAEPRLMVCDPSSRTGLEPIAARVGGRVETLGSAGDGSFMEHAARFESTFENHPAEPDDLAAILYTSGTTGRSKGAMLSHRNLASNATVLARLWRFTADDVLIHALPIYHTHGLFVATNVVLLAGASMIFLPKFDVESVFSNLPLATTLMGVPTFYTRMLQDPRLTREATSHMRLFVSGSAPLLSETHREWQDKTGHAILERYGMTETGMNTSNPYDGDRIAGTVGFPLTDVELRVVDPESGRPLGPNEIGMIEVKGPNVFKAYWRMPEKTAAEFRADGFFITGDLGQVDERGYVRIVGRGKDLIITGGFNVYPKEVESEIDSLPGVVESAVIGVAHPDLGEGVTAIVVAEPGVEIDEAAILEHLGKRLARFKLPKRIFLVPELPRNTMGKVQKNMLRETYGALYAKNR
jgi:malonyl-CoA/methylmalonyl-CoA synthetase